MREVWVMVSEAFINLPCTSAYGVRTGCAMVRGREPRLCATGDMRRGVREGASSSHIRAAQHGYGTRALEALRARTHFRPLLL